MFLFFNPLGVHCLVTEKSKSKIMPCYFSISFFALFWKVERIRRAKGLSWDNGRRQQS